MGKGGSSCVEAIRGGREVEESRPRSVVWLLVEFRRVQPPPQRTLACHSLTYKTGCNRVSLARPVPESTRTRTRRAGDPSKPRRAGAEPHLARYATTGTRSCREGLGGQFGTCWRVQRWLWRSRDGLRTVGQGRAQLCLVGETPPVRPARSLAQSQQFEGPDTPRTRQADLFGAPLFSTTPSPTRETRHPPAACRANRTMAEQVEKSFQKQPLFHNAKVATTSRKVAGKDRRWYKEVGLGFKVRLGCSSSTC